MHSRRIATFLVGAWMAGCLFMAFLQIQSLRAPNLVMAAPAGAAAKIIQALGQEQARLLLGHMAAEEIRHNLRQWETLQLPLGLALGAFLFLATEKRLPPLVLCVVMLAMVVIQYAATPELVYRGRQTDFPPGNTAAGTLLRYAALQEFYIGLEAVKLAAGAILASYLFVFRKSVRKREVEFAAKSAYGSR